jgi:hypothetical protein
MALGWAFAERCRRRTGRRVREDQKRNKKHTGTGKALGFGKPFTGLKNSSLMEFVSLFVGEKPNL